MKPKREWIQYCYLGCLLVLISLGIVTLVSAYYGLEVNLGILTAITIGWTILLICFEHNKKNVVPYLILMILAIAAFITLRATDIDVNQVISDYGSWLGKILSGDVTDEISQVFAYEIVSCMLVLIIVSVLVYLCLKRYRLRIIIAVLNIVILVVLSVIQCTVSKLGISCLVTYSFIILTEFMYHSQYRERKITGTKGMAFLVPMLLIMAVILVMLPANKEPIQWKIAKQCWYKLSDSIEQLFSNIDLWLNPDRSEFSLSFSGYSEDGSVGGTLSDSDNLALSVSTTSLQTSNIYLTGNVKNNYDGKKWTDTTQQEENQDTTKEYVLDGLELLYAMDRAGIEQDNVSSIYNMRGLTVSYEYLTTKSMFYPLKLYDLETKNSLLYQNHTANFIFDETQHRGTNYSFYYLNLNLGSEYLNALIQGQETYRYQQNDTGYQEDFRTNYRANEWPKEMNIPEHLESMLYTRAETIREEYTQVYDGLPDRVRELAYNITKDCTGDYEKCMAIEEFLSSYTYTTTPKQPGKNQDLIDFMLFDSREGYCTYYATAFAILARCVSIPTRYVQGFCVPVASQEDRFFYIVYDHNAHAWAESYIEGIGWMTFEPTPTYYGMLYQPWLSYEDCKNTSQVQLGDMEEEEELNDSQAYPDFLKELEQTKENEKQQTYRSAGIIAIIVVGAVILAIPCYILFRIFRKKRCYVKKRLDQKMYADMEQIFLMMSYIGHRIEPLETLQAYFTRLAKSYPKLQEDFEKCCQSYTRLRYEDGTVKQEDQVHIRILLQRLLEEIKQENGKARYLILLVRLL